jgi:hypothetical protein
MACALMMQASDNMELKVKKEAFFTSAMAFNVEARFERINWPRF